MTLIYTLFGAVPLPVYDPEGPQGLGPVTLPAVPLGLGGALNPEGASGRAPRQGGLLQYNGSYLSDTVGDVVAAVDAIKAKIGTEARLYAQTTDGVSTRWAQAVLVDVQGTATGEHVLHADLGLMFQILSPFWNGVARTFSVVDPYDDGDDLPCTGAEGITSGSITLTNVLNGGNVPQTQIAITVTARAGTLTAFTLTSVTTGHGLLWAGSLPANQAVVIDTGKLSVLKNGVDNYSGFTPPSVKARWMELNPGSNTWTFSITGVDAELSIVYADAWG